MESCIACSVMEAQSRWLCCHQQHTLSCQSGVVGAYKPEQDSMVLPVSSACFHVWRKASPKKELDQRTNHAVCGTEADEHAKWSKLGAKEKHHVMPLMTRNLNYDTDGLSMKQSELWTERADRCRGGGGRGGLAAGEFGISRCGLGWPRCTEGINNEVLLYSTRNYIHYLGRNHNGKGYKKQSVYRYRYNTDIEM